MDWLKRLLVGDQGDGGAAPAGEEWREEDADKMFPELAEWAKKRD